MVKQSKPKNNEAHSPGQLGLSACALMEPFQVPEGKPEKKGEIYTFSNGATYTGAIRNGKMHGAGHFVDPSGGSYDGEWKDGIMHGRGTCISSDGEKYVGEYQEGVPHGRGTYTFKNGNEYIGEYNDGKIHGEGVIRFPDNRRFTGTFRDNKKHGRGRYEGATGVYEGEYRDGKKEGTGTFTWIDGSSYVGPWLRDYMHGENGLKRERDGSLFRVHHDMGKLVSAVPVATPDGAPHSIGGAGNPLSNFSDVSLAPSIAGGMSAPGQPSLQRPGQPSLQPHSAGGPAAAAAGPAFHRTLSKPGEAGYGSANGDGGGNGGGESAPPLPPPIAWVREQWAMLTDTMGCGGARQGDRQPSAVERARDACGGGCGFPTSG